MITSLEQWKKYNDYLLKTTKKEEYSAGQYDDMKKEAVMYTDLIKKYSEYMRQLNNTASSFAATAAREKSFFNMY